MWLHVLPLCVFAVTVMCTVKFDRPVMPPPPNFYPWNMSRLMPPEDGEDLVAYAYRLTDGRTGHIALDEHRFLEEHRIGGYHGSMDVGRRYKDVVPDFDCVVPAPAPVATSVHRLRPADVSVVAAMGDSITAAFGADAYTLIDLFIEFREVSFSGGGGKTLDKLVTFANIVKKYNSRIIGYATFPTLVYVEAPWQKLDAAVSGSTSYELLAQAHQIVQELKQPKYDTANSWKVITLFIGGNDLCSCCLDGEVEKYSPENYIKGIEEALDYLHEHVPKLFVNLLTPPDVTILEDLTSYYCDFLHYIECKCGTVMGAAARNFTHARRKEYTKKIFELIDSGKYESRDDFTVVVQPFFEEAQIPRHPDKSVDRSYFAPDCFHFSGKAHAATSLALWNGMLESVGKKTQSWQEHEAFICPTDKSPYFFTNKNSKPAPPPLKEWETEKRALNVTEKENSYDDWNTFFT